jgi:hypothetical protein
MLVAAIATITIRAVVKIHAGREVVNTPANHAALGRISDSRRRKQLNVFCYLRDLMRRPN